MLNATGACAGGQLDLSLAYSPKGNLTSMGYAHGRQVTYTFGDGGLRDREIAISMNTFLADGGTGTQSIIDSVQWEPYGGLRSYRMQFADGGTATLTHEFGAAGSAPASDCPTTGALSETEDATGRVRSIRLASSAGSDLYRKMYQWNADQVDRVATCYKQDGQPVVESFQGSAPNGYDSAGRLRGAAYSYASPMVDAKYTYDGRGNTTQFKTAGSSYYTLTYPSSGSTIDRLSEMYASWDSSGNRNKYEYDEDGQTVRIYGPNDSSAYPAFQNGLQYFNDDNFTPGSLTAVNSLDRQVADSYVTTRYWYDTQQRRQAKFYPLNQTYDLFLYDLGHQLLEDRGNVDLVTVSPTVFPIDEYVWLGGRAVAVVRAKVTRQTSGLFTHGADGAGTCTKLGELSDCGLYFIVNDHLPKPVLALNNKGQISGVGEYSPYGQVNTTPYWWATYHPYSLAENGTWSTTLTRQALGGLPVRMRIHVPLLDTDADAAGNLRDKLIIGSQSLGGYHRGETWSNWHAATLSAGVYSLPVYWQAVTGNCYPNGGGCPGAGLGHPYSGFSMRSFQYQRFESTNPFFPPLRFPGHYFDEESNLHENWHRFYDPFPGRYLSPEPLLQSPSYVRLRAGGGYTLPVYAYAQNNPLRYTDPTGLCDADSSAAKHLAMNGGNACKAYDTINETLWYRACVKGRSVPDGRGGEIPAEKLDCTCMSKTMDILAKKGAEQGCMKPFPVSCDGEGQ